MISYQVLPGDVRETLATLGAESVQCVVTSPPYWGLRDYGVSGQIGLERTPEEFIDAMREVFAQVWRVLRNDGTLWLNIGDSYASGGCGARDPGRWPKQSRNDHMPRHAKSLSGLKPKDLVGIPWMLAFALRSDGWYLRQDIIWSKPTPMPESVTDRCTKSHEYLFLLSKSPRYHYDVDAIREPLAAKTRTTYGSRREPAEIDDHRVKSKRFGDTVADRKPRLNADGTVAGANKRSVWNIAAQPFPEAHFATFPEALVEPCVLAGSRPGDTILDPFNGSGTTGVVALKHQRSYIGCELNAEYVEMARRRLAAVAPMFAREVPA